jgi:hypothetical protein
MSTARGLLMRLLKRGRLHPAVHEEHPSAEPPTEQRLEAARQRLKQTIPPSEAPRPGEGPSPAFEDPPPKSE